MSPAPHPRMHGLSHVGGGPDPIPGLLPALGGSFDGVVLAIPDLLGYWRLGEPTGPWADSSGVAPAATLTEQDSGTAVTPDVVGALIAAQDDGAVELTYDGTAEHGGRYLQSSGSGKDFDFPGSAGQMTVGAWVQVTGSILTRRGMIIGNQNWAVAGDGYLVGWALNVMYPSMAIRFTRGQPPGGSIHPELYAETTGGVVADTWYFVVGSYDGTMIRLYMNAELVDETPDTSLAWHVNNTISIGHGVAASGAPAWFTGTIDEAAVWTRALTQAEINALYQAGLTGEGGGPGWVLVIDENGNPVWRPPPAMAITIGGEEQTGPNTPLPVPDPPPTDPGDTFPGDVDWIVDQPFTHGGGTFTVQPKTWTTIPFTTPLMQRWSNVTGEGTTFTELDWDDPASAGWIDPDEPRTITVPHDMPFLADAQSWMQICLKLEDPMVQPNSYRALRVFETTHQKTVLTANAQRAAAATGGGGVSVSWDEDIHPGGLFASDGQGGTHGNIMYMPNSEYAFFLSGNGWLPKVDGVRTLTAGMRLLAQVWHDATVPLVFDCSDPFPYRPHFVVFQTVERDWGPPWSDWPVFTP